VNYKITTIPGDGIGPDIVREGCRVLDEVGKKYGHSFAYTEVLAGGSAIDATGEPLPKATSTPASRATPSSSARSAARSGTPCPEQASGEGPARPPGRDEGLREPPPRGDVQAASAACP
jgi:hypothetical protein